MGFNFSRTGRRAHSYDRTGIEANIPMIRVVWVGVLVLIGLLLWLIACRIYGKTEGARKLAEERAEAEKRLAEIRKRTVSPPPVFWIPSAGALVFLLCALWLLLFGLSHGPPFGW